MDFGLSGKRVDAISLRNRGDEKCSEIQYVVEILVSIVSIYEYYMKRSVKCHDNSLNFSIPLPLRFHLSSEIYFLKCNLSNTPSFLGRVVGCVLLVEPNIAEREAQTAS